MGCNYLNKYALDSGDARAVCVMHIVYSAECGKALAAIAHSNGNTDMDTEAAGQP